MLCKVEINSQFHLENDCYEDYGLPACDYVNLVVGASVSEELFVHLLKHLYLSTRPH